MEALSIYINHWLIDSNKAQRKKAYQKYCADLLSEELKLTKVNRLREEALIHHTSEGKYLIERFGKSPRIYSYHLEYCFGYNSSIFQYDPKYKTLNMICKIYRYGDSYLTLKRIFPYI